MLPGSGGPPGNILDSFLEEDSVLPVLAPLPLLSVASRLGLGSLGGGGLVEARRRGSPLLWDEVGFGAVGGGASTISVTSSSIMPAGGPPITVVVTVGLLLELAVVLFELALASALVFVLVLVLTLAVTSWEFVLASAVALVLALALVFVWGELAVAGALVFVLVLGLALALALAFVTGFFRK